MFSRFPGIFLLLSLCICPLMAKSLQTREAAAARFAQVGDVAYTLFFNLGPDQPGFEGRTRIAFKLRHNRADLVVDFSGEAVKQLVLDGKPFSDFRFDADAAQIILAAAALTPGDHVLELETVGSYTDDGVGMMRFLDPEDQRTYIYTDFEPQEAHRAFPCFDQPDLKATYDVEAKTPSDWSVISNTPAISARMEEGAKITSFKRSKRFSTYLFHISAGPYASFHDPDFTYPLAVYCRQSMVKYIDAAEILEQTRRGFHFFETYFDYPYPFEKYDQIFCPNYASGAMENVGAVTFSEAYIPKKPFSSRRSLDRKLTIWHEMAHQWFGDLVTMKWWDNLWLNESFATYMSYIAADGLGEPNTWQDAATTRNGAISLDLSPGTHPVLADVPDTAAASSIFDNITYGKGFCVLRQLDLYLGGTTFRDGLRIYFRTNAWKNTGLNEFTSALEESHGSDLSAWMAAWLGTTGVNALRLELELAGGKISRATLHQTPGKNNEVLREHATVIGLFYRDDKGQVTLAKSVPVRSSGARTEVPQLIGESAPELALPNVDQSGYVLDVLDAATLNWLKTNFASLSDDTIKQHIYATLTRMVYDGQWDPTDLIALTEHNLAQQRDPSLAALMSDFASNLLFYCAPSQELANAHARALFALIRPLVADAEPDLQRQWLQLLDNCAEISGDTQFLVDRFEDKIELNGYKPSNFVKWRLLERLVDKGYPAEAMIEQLKSEDESSTGKNALLRLTTLKPDLENKRNTWKKLVAIEGPNQDLRAMSAGFGSINQGELLKEFIPQYFEALPRIYEEHGFGYLNGFGNALWPDYGGAKTVTMAHNFLKRKDLAEPVRRMVASLLSGLEERMRTRDQWSKSTKAQG